MPRWLQFLLFFSAGAAFWSCICWYVGTKVARALKQEGKKARPTKLLVWFTAFIYPLGTMLERFFWPGPVATGLTILGSYMIGIVSIALSLFLTADLAVWLYRLVRWLLPGSRDRTFRAWRKHMGARLPVKAYVALLVVAATACGAAIWQGHRTPQVRRLQVQAPPGSTLQRPVTLVQISDLHLGRLVGPDAMARIVNEVKALAPDLLVVTGDLFDDATDNAAEAVSLLSQVNPPLGKFVTNGNHEHYVGGVFCENHAADAGLRMLRQERIFIAPGLTLAGVDDRHLLRDRNMTPEQAVEEALRDVRDDDYVVLLTHRPEAVQSAAGSGADLILAGHTHGGQVPPFQLFSPMGNHGFLYGLYNVGNAQLYVTSGAGTWGPRMRLFAPSEIVHITILPATGITHPKPVLE